MLDPKFIRENFEAVKLNCRNRNSSAKPDIWLELDNSRLLALHDVESLRAERNAIADKMKSAEKGDRDGLISRGKELKQELAVKEEMLNKLDAEWTAELLAFPNLTHPAAPIGLSEGDSREIKQVGKIPEVALPLSHVELGERLDILDFTRGAKVAGAKFYFLKNQGALLEQALVRFALDYLVKEGFIPMTTPDLAKDEVLIGTGFQPRGPETQIYSIENSDLSLIGTAEITLGGYHMGETLDPAKLPLKYVGVSHCFRTEAGAYGKESYGLYRVHQFTKIEMFAYAAPEQSEALHQEMLRHEENIFQALEIPYRVLDIASGDLGGPAYRKFDIEAWMWGRNGGKGEWGEVTSASNCTDFQARRLGVKTKDEEGNSIFVHTLNGTAIAVSRALIALLETHQQKDGSIKIPKALQSYCGFKVIKH